MATALGNDPNFGTTILTAISNKVDKITGKGLSTEDYTSTEKSKLGGIAAGATVNTKLYNGHTLVTGAFPIVKKATVSGGNFVVHLTSDGTSGGTALFANVYLDSLQLSAIDGVAPHMYGTPVLSNSNKTLTVPVTKSAGVYVSLLSLTLLGAAAAANGTEVRALIYGN